MYVLAHTFLSSQQAHDVKMTSDRRRCDVIHATSYDVILTSCARWDVIKVLRFFTCTVYSLYVQLILREEIFK